MLFCGNKGVRPRLGIDHLGRADQRNAADDVERVTPPGEPVGLLLVHVRNQRTQ